jgi:hypothetical protein
MFRQVSEHSTNELFIASLTTAAAPTEIRTNRATGSVSYWLILRVLNNIAWSPSFNTARKEKKMIMHGE